MARITPFPVLALLAYLDLVVTAPVSQPHPVEREDMEVGHPSASYGVVARTVPEQAMGGVYAAVAGDFKPLPKRQINELVPSERLLPNFVKKVH